ncbi:AsmA-like C-terminal domain-containing protein [Arcobacter arenosus]|uniref:YhdP family protein n=1 Tax=Arcobacter arenosus TaxID=2576037 RepID=UPI003BAC1317
MLKLIKLIIIVLLVLFLGLGVSLFSGIKIDSFSFNNFSVSQFYLKYDKKLILEIDELKINSKLLASKEDKTSQTDILNILSNVKKVLSFFKKIDVERIKIADNEFTVTLNNKLLYLDNKDINLSADLDLSASQIFLNFYSVYHKQSGLTLIGKSKLDLSKNIFNFFGTYYYEDISGEINAQVANNIFDFYVNSKNSFKSMKFLKQLFRLDSVAEAWMYDNVEGDINLEYLYGKIDIEKKQAIMDSIKGRAYIKDAKIRFNEKAKTVDTKLLTINYKNDTLYFDLENPTYNESKLYGSKVYITDLTSLQKGVVHVDLKSESMLNDDILGILKAYEINLPLKQSSGELKSRVYLKVPYLASRKMEVLGEFKLKDALLRLNNFEFKAFEADVELKDNIVDIKNSRIKHKEMLESNLSLVIDTNTSTATGEAKINSFKIQSDKESIIDAKDISTKLDVDFKESAKIDIKDLETKIDIKEKSVDIDIKDLKKIYPYSKLLDNAGIKEGDLQVKVFDENNIEFTINAKNLDYPFSKDGEKIDKLSANGTINNDLILIKTNNNDIQIVLEKEKNPLIKLNNVDLDLSNNTKKDSKDKALPNIDLQLKNSFLILDDKHKYKTSWANIYIKNKNVKFEGEALYLDLPISKNGKQVRSLELNGDYKNRIVDLITKDKKLKLKYEIDKEKITMDLEDFDVIYNTNQESDDSSKTSYYINGKNSNIIINEKYIAKADNYNFIFENYKTDIDLKYKDTTFVYHKDFEGVLSVDAKNMNDEFLNSILGKNLVQGGTVNINASGKDGKIYGTAFLEKNKILDLAILNNLLILINTSPGIINPFLVIPSVVGMATNEGFNLNGYRVIEGRVDFSYDFNSKFLNMQKITTKGNGIDFDGNATIDFDSSKIDSKLHLVFLKDYSKIVGAIPVINYVLLGDEKRVDTEVEIFGTLDDPKYKTNLVKDGVSAPVNFLKRVITSPVKLIETIGEGLSGDKKKE